jgi:tetratricopeptide (TPR) repeat protein
MTPKNFLAVALLIFPLCTCRSQNLDSLRDMLKSTTGNERIDLLYAISSHLVENDAEFALTLAREAMMLSSQSCDELRITRTGVVAGIAYRRLGLLDSAIQVYERILPIARANNYANEILSILNGYALAHTFRADYDKALNYFFASLSNESVYNDSLTKSVTLHNTGLVYYKLKQYEKALRFFQTSHLYKEAISESHDLDVLTLNIGLCYIYLNDYTRASEYIRRALAVCGGACSRQILMESSFAQGVLNYRLGAMTPAAEHFNRSYELSKALNDVRFQLDNIDYLSKIFIEVGDFSSAAHFLRIGEDLIGSFSALTLEKSKIYSRLYDLYGRLKNYRLASEYQFKYIALRDSVYSENLALNLMNVEAQYMEREYRLRLDSQNELLLLNKMVIRRQKAVNAVSILLIGVSIAFCVVLIRNYRNKTMLNRLLDKKVDERTEQLQKSGLEVRKKFSEQMLRQRRTLRNVQIHLSRIQALCLLALKDTSDSSVTQYFEHINASAKDIQAIVAASGPTEGVSNPST